MAERTDKWTLTWTRYEEPVWGILRLGPGRFSINFYHWTLVVELWFLRNGGLKYQ